MESRICKICGENKPLSELTPYYNKECTKTKYRKVCKKCHYKHGSTREKEKRKKEREIRELEKKNKLFIYYND